MQSKKLTDNYQLDWYLERYYQAHDTFVLCLQERVVVEILDFVREELLARLNELHWKYDSYLKEEREDEN